VIYSLVGIGGVYGTLITSHKEVGWGGLVLQENDSEGTDRETKGEECVEERERGR